MNAYSFTLRDFMGEEDFSKLLAGYRSTASRIMDKFDWFKNEFENNISKEEQIEIFNRMHIWETKINIDDYINDMYDNYFNLKPEDMDDDKFYDIVEDAVFSSDFESDILNNIKKAVSEQ